MPGIVSKNYAADESIDILVGALDSHKTNLPFHFYALQWCNNTKNDIFDEEEVGQAVEGDALIASPLDYQFGRHKKGIIPCERTYNEAEVNEFSFFMQHNYHYKLYLDGLPSATILRGNDGKEIVDYFEGIPVGHYNVKDESLFIYNHLEIEVEVTRTPEGHERIVAFDVEPFSIRDDEDRFLFSKKMEAKPKLLRAGHKVIFTYSIYTKVNKSLTLSHRLDHYVKIGSNQVHTLQLIISFSIVVGLGLIVTLILRRQLQSDFNKIEMVSKSQKDLRKKRLQARREGATQEEVTGLTNNALKEIEKDDVAWKKLSGDVMRVPKYPMILSFLMGTGIHIFVLVYVFLLSMTIGFFNVFLRATWVFSFFLILAGGGWFNGFVTALCMKTAGLTDWIGGATVAAFVYPALVLACFTFVDIIEWLEKSANRTPLTSMFLYGAIWMAFSIGATYHGASVGYNQQSLHTKIRVNPVKRKIPSQPYYMSLFVLMPIFGAIQFGCIFVEFMYIWNSMWRSNLYAMFGSLFLCMLLLVLVVSEISIIQTYFQIRHENHEWQWRTFWTGASCGFYVAAYTFYYMVYTAKMDLFAGELIYLVWAGLSAYSAMILCGMIALVASSVFVESIY